MSRVQIIPAAASDLRRVLRLALSVRGQSRADLERQVTAFIQYARAMSLDLTRQWICQIDGRLAAACACIESPGRTAILFLPDSEAVRTEPAQLTDLIRHVVQEESCRDVRLLQCLAVPEDRLTAQTLLTAGFRDLAVLLYLEWAARPLPVPPTRGAPLSTPEWIAYDTAHHDEFARLIAATYEDTLDCPGLAGLRDMEDVIAGHKAAGRFQPHLWLLLRCAGDTAGCILFGENPLRTAVELVYMGVHPRFRRRGVGRLLLHHGLVSIRAEGFEGVTVAVDAANSPALRLYESLGFRRISSRRALIRPLVSTS